jgi:parallel beta-helix repeat protein
MRAMPAAALAATFAISVVGCSDVSGPAEVQQNSSPDLSVSAAAQVVVYPGQSIQAAVNGHPTGTTFLLKAGTHKNQRVVPKSGDVFLGEAGTVLDGGGTVPFAFEVGSSYPSNVTVKGLVIQHYAPGTRRGAVNAGDNARRTTGWVVSNCEIRDNVGAGLKFGDQMQVLNNYIHHNDQIGAVGGGDGILFEGNEVAYNNPAWHYQFGFELGGIKFAYTDRLVARGNYVHDNNGPGMWTDFNNINSLIEGNRVVNNAGTGIFHEISYAAVIRNNVATGNGFKKTGLYGGGIMVSASPDVEVYGNTVTGNAMGIGAEQADRSSFPAFYGPHLVKNLYVHDNTVRTAGQTGIHQIIGTNSIYTSWNNRFQHNTYTGLAANRAPFFWMNGKKTVSQWKGYGQDLTGTFHQ